MGYHSFENLAETHEAMYRIVFTVILIIGPLVLNGQEQEKLTYAEVNPLTYQLYADQNWHALIREGKRAIREGVDYYYLRMRIGIAYYELKRYQASIPHFEKALAENPDNPTPQEYLYYAYLFSGRQMDAMYIAKKFSDDLKQKTGINEEMSVQSLSFSYTGSSYNTEESIEGTQALDSNVGDGFQSIPKRFSLFGLTVNHKMGNSVILSHTAQLLRKTNFVFSQFSGLNYTIPNQTITQFQYYISPAIRAAKGLTVMPAFHFISYRIPGVVTSSGMGGRTTLSESSVNNDYIVSLAVNQAMQYLNAGLSFSYGTLNNKKQYQPGVELTVYPLGNLNLYSTIKAYKLLEYYGSDQIADRRVLQNITGFKVFSWLWFEAEGSWGDYANFSEYNGAVVYNSLDEINNRYAGRAILWLNQGHLQFILSYNYTDFTNYYYPNIITDEFINTIHYSSNTFTGGIIWKL